MGHEGGDAIVVAEADLVVGDGVVLVDHRHHAQLEQALQRAPGVQVLAPHAEVERGEQHLAGHQRVGREGPVVDRHQPAWPTADTAWSVRASRAAGCRPARGRQARRHGTGGDGHDLVAVGPEAGEPLDEHLDGGLVDPSLVVGDRGGPDLGDDDHLSSVLVDLGVPLVVGGTRTRTGRPDHLAGAPRPGSAPCRRRGTEAGLGVLEASTWVRSERATARSAARPWTRQAVDVPGDGDALAADGPVDHEGRGFGLGGRTSRTASAMAPVSAASPSPVTAENQCRPDGVRRQVEATRRRCAPVEQLGAVGRQLGEQDPLLLRR